MKKILTLSLLLLLLLGVLAACGGEQPAVVEDAAEAETEAEAEVEAEAEAPDTDELNLAKLADKGVLTVGTAITKPFEFHDPDTNELIGFDVDVSNYIADKLGVTVEFSEMPFASLIPSLETRKVDMTIAAMYIKPEREEVVDFATPYMETGLVMVVAPELAGEVTTPEDLGGRKVGVKIGATGDALAQEYMEQGIDLERLEYKETLESFADLEFGRVDAVLNDYLNTLAYLKDTGSDAHVVKNDDGTVNFLSNVGLGIAVHDGDAELLAEINTILEEMHADGTYDALYEKWLGVVSSGEASMSDDPSLADVQEKGVLTVGTAITKPFEYHDPDTNELIGFDVDVANYIADSLGVTVEFSEMPFASLIPSLETRKVDMTIAAMYIKPEREEVVDFATPYMETGLVMVVSPELAGEVTTPEDLGGRKVGVKIGATGDALAQEFMDQGIDLERLEYKETLESFADLEFGRVDAVLNDYLNTLAYLKDTGSDAHVVMNDDGTVNFLSNVGLGIAVHDGDGTLLDEINAILEEMHANGTYDELYEKWLGVVSGGEASMSDDPSLADVQEKGVLTVGTAITKPFEYHDPDTNELIGFDVDVANYIADSLGVTVEFSEMPFASLIPSLETRKVDMTIAAMYIKPEREEVVDFAVPYMETGLVMVVASEFAEEITTPEDLGGRKVGVKIGATGDALAQEYMEKGIDLERLEYKETLESFADLEFGRVDAVLNDYLNTLAYLKDTGSDAHVVKNDDGTVNFLSHVGLGIAVHDGDGTLLDEINAILVEMHANGTYDELYEKWLGVTQ